MWEVLFSALGLAMVLEGIGPFINPDGFRRALQILQQLPDSAFRYGGLAVMTLGLALMYLVR